MDKSILVQYSDLKAEMKDLRNRISILDKQIGEMKTVSDTVTCGKRGKKPISSIKITGFPYPEFSRKKALRQAYRTRLERTEAKLFEVIIQVEDYIESIPQSEVRIMFRLYFLDDLRWAQVALRMNKMFPRRPIAYTEENCKKRCNRYLDSVG